MPQEDFRTRGISRRSALKRGAVTAAVMSQAVMLEQLALAPLRPAFAATPAFSDIQFDIGRFINPAQTVNDGAGNVVVQFGPVFSLLVPAVLSRNPTKSDQTVLANALNTIEATFPASPSGVLIASVSYGIPYFNRLPQTLVQANIPRLRSNTSRFVLEEAKRQPTDVPNVTKDRFNVPVVIERNDMLFQFRSDSSSNLTNVLNWLQGSNTLNGQAIASPAFNGLIQFQTPRVQFVQIGMPRRVADANNLEFAPRINPDSPMAMGFTDQQTNASGPPQIVTFVGNSEAKFSTANPGDYFDNGSIAHLSHDIEDLFQFYALANQDSRHPDGEPFTERCQYMFRSNQLGTSNGIPAAGNTDQFTNGGGPAHINNVFNAIGSATAAARDGDGTFAPGHSSLDATFTGTGRIGHIDALQQVSRVNTATNSGSDTTPIHIRNDGPGFDGMDVPSFQMFPGGPTVAAGTPQFKLQFLMFVPTADLFDQMRTKQAALDLQNQFNVDPDDNGLERFITATRRQNYLVPPRRHRSFPLLELT